jgi:flagellar basal-body rod modification protein FlgD
MTVSISSATTLLSAAEKAAKTASATAASTSSSPSSASASSTALSSIAGNFNSFLTMLTTQLKNQDPSSPMNADQFTTELATFAGVQQQVNTNTNLGQLISLGQNGQLTSDSSLVGQKATFTSSQISLQSGTGHINFTTGSVAPVAIAVTDASGNVVRTVQETSVAGSNSWTWNGKDDSGNSLADGAYGIAVQTQDATGKATSSPFTVTGVITGVSKSSSGGVMLKIGSESVDMNNVNSTGSAA